MGKGDIKTKRGKITNKSYGARRPRKASKITPKTTAKPKPKTKAKAKAKTK